MENIKELITKELTSIMERLYEISEGKLQKFEDEDPIASVKDYINGLIEYTSETRGEITSIFNEFEK